MKSSCSVRFVHKIENDSLDIHKLTILSSSNHEILPKGIVLLLLPKSQTCTHGLEYFRCTAAVVLAPTSVAAGFVLAAGFLTLHWDVGCANRQKKTH
jgi:hypothetical protein